MPVKGLTPNWHFQLIERILCHIIRIQFVHFPHDNIDVGLVRFREQEKLRACKCLEAREAKVGRFEYFNACSLVERDAEGGRREGFGDCVDTRSGQPRLRCASSIQLRMHHTREMCQQGLVGR